MNIKNIIGGIIGNIKRDGFDWSDIIVPILLEAAKEFGKKILDGEKANETWVAVIQFAYYGTYRFYDLLVKNEDETYTDEVINALREVLRDAAAEGNFELDIPDDLE
jgi:hypothetical protein